MILCTLFNLSEFVFAHFIFFVKSVLQDVTIVRFAASFHHCSGCASSFADTSFHINNNKFFHALFRIIVTKVFPIVRPFYVQQFR